MCGLIGIVSNKREDLLEMGSKALHSLVHRGPDYSEKYYSENIFLGLNRLSIFDTTEKAHQPFLFNDYVIVFNGAIFNFELLRSNLTQRGHQFITNSDTEVLLKSYIEWGPGFENELNGMWSFIIYNSKSKTTYVSRDRYGIKPLYFIRNSNKIVFSSEIKAFYQFEWWRPEINNNLIGKSQLTDLILNINEFKKGHYALIDHKLNFQEHKYYNFFPYDDNFSIEEATTSFRILLKDSIQLRTKADVPVGLSLSGGLDSTSIASLLEVKVPAISAVFNEKEADETKYIKAILRQTQHDSHLVRPQCEHLVTKIEEITEIQEIPFFTLSLIAQNQVFEEANKLGLKVMLTGQGADELLYGYDSFIKRYLQLSTSKRSFNYFKDVFLIFLCHHSLVLKSIFFQNNSSVFSNRDAKNSYKHLKDYAWYTLWNDPLPMLLHYEDRNSMSYGIESRLPFLDHRLVELCFSLPYNFHFEIGERKKLLKNAMIKSLPISLIKRKDKMAYTTPTKKWVNKHKKDLLDVASKVTTLLGKQELNARISSLDNKSLIYLTSLYYWLEKYG